MGANITKKSFIAFQELKNFKFLERYKRKIYSILTTNKNYFLSKCIFFLRF